MNTVPFCINNSRDGPRLFTCLLRMTKINNNIVETRIQLHNLKIILFL